MLSHWYDAYLICSFQLQGEADLWHLHELRLAFFVITTNDTQSVTV